MTCFLAGTKEITVWFLSPLLRIDVDSQVQAISLSHTDLARVFKLTGERSEFDRGYFYIVHFSYLLRFYD